MKRFVPLFALFLLLTGCRSKVDTEPVWQKTLPCSGAQVTLANCEGREAAGIYREEAGQEQPAVLLEAEGIPVLTVARQGGDPVTVTIDFAKYLEDGVYGQDVSSPMPKLDYVFTEREDGALQYRFDTVYSFYLEITGETGTDRLLLVCHRDID